MKIRFFGGANEVGASSTLIEIDGCRILVDAGIRMNHEHENDLPLPDFPDFDKEGMPDAVLVTHAHTDHTGALPVPELRDLWQTGVKLYWTPATKAITQQVLLEDSVNRTQEEEQNKNGPPLYKREDLDILLNCMQKEVSWLEPEEIYPGVTATWIPAGHILGAAMIYIQGKQESILMTGDVSGPPQLTIPGMAVPTWCKPDVMVMEATYGNDQHEVIRKREEHEVTRKREEHEVTRKREEKRLIEDVTKTIAAGGKVLIPAFAVGRSQEVILISKRAMERKQIPFPVYVDGMVKKVNRIYSEFPNELSPSLKRIVEQGESLFYSDSIKEVFSKKKSESILDGPPCCIVASSGMLIGGKSSFYAKHLAKDPKNLIAITGYQAEGTPGRALEELPKVDGHTMGEWKLDAKTSVTVNCQVEKYSLSAHSDSDQLLELVEEVQPRTLFLVHGDDKARKELRKSVRKKFPTIDVELPKNGRTYTVRKYEGIAKGRKLRHDRILQELSDFLHKNGLKGPFSPRYLAERWFGSEAITPIVVSFFQWCLSLDSRFFKRKKSGDLYDLRQSI